MIQKISIFIIACVVLLSVQANAISEQNAVPAVNAVTQTATSLGVLTCAKRINEIATFLTANSKSGAFVFPPSKQQPDKSVFSSSMEINPANAPAMYASASFYPNSNNGCDAIYDTVEYVDDLCANVETSVFKNGTRIGKIKKDIVIMAVGQVKFFLMPAGQGCVVIKKEILQ